MALWLSSHYGLPFVGYYLLSGAVCTLVALYFSRTLEISDAPTPKRYDKPSRA